MKAFMLVMTFWTLEGITYKIFMKNYINLFIYHLLLTIKPEKNVLF